MATELFQLNVIYSFTTKTPGFTNLSYNNAKFVSKMNYAEASKLSNISSQWVSIYPYLSNDGANDIINNPSAYSYYKFSLSNNDFVILAEPWININSIRVVKSIAVTINITGLTDLADVDDITSMLNNSGYTDFTVTVINPS